MRHLAKLLFMISLAVGLAACASRPPKPSGPTVVEVHISAAENINPGKMGDGLPIPVRLYRLSSRSAFDAAEFDQIYNEEMKTLGGHLVGITQFVLFPGQSEVITRRFNERERDFGIVVAYKNGAPNWRASTSIPPGETTRLDIRLGKDGVSLDKL